MCLVLLSGSTKQLILSATKIPTESDRPLSHQLLLYFVAQRMRLNLKTCHQAESVTHLSLLSVSFRKALQGKAVKLRFNKTSQNAKRNIQNMLHMPHNGNVLMCYNL